MKYSAVALVFALAACGSMLPAASSNQVLAMDRTWVIVSKPAQPAAVDVVRMFHERGITLMDMQPFERGVILRFKAERTIVAVPLIEPLDAALATSIPTSESQVAVYPIGSVYYARVEPRGETMTLIAIMGRPTRGGVEACTPDPDVKTPCARLASDETVHGEIAGYAEAEMINSIFTQLRVEGLVVAPVIQTTRIANGSRTPLDKCLERRRDVEARAARVSSGRAKAGILRTAPRCEAAALAGN